MSEVKGVMAPFNTISRHEREAVEEAVQDPLSGFLGGELRGGKRVRALEDKWAERFGVKHAIACNSATSGLMAAAFAVGLEQGDQFICSPYTMSATVAAPMFTDAEPDFFDVERETFCLDSFDDYLLPKAIIITNLFGHPSKAMELATRMPARCFLIEDNSQSPFSMEQGCYAGTFGDIGVFSLNVHKHLQCGEGGVCVTDNDELADKLRRFVNHGEMAGGSIGLNLRLNEISAAIALTQLNRADEIIGGRIEQAEAILFEIGEIPALSPPITRKGCRHVYYAIPFLLRSGVLRSNFVARLKEEGVPISEGYVAPLYSLPAFQKYERNCPVAEWLSKQSLLYFENCAWSPTKAQIKQIGSAFRKVAEEMKL